MSFNNLNLIKPLQTALANEGYTIPTPIQQQAIPVILERKDLLGCAQTGTGKTAAFAVPILQILSEAREPGRPKRRTIKALILTPTRELAVQVGESFSVYGKHTGLKNTVVFGGVSQFSQTAKLKHGIDILVATPGRLLDLVNQKYIDLSRINLFVLDEADRMLDMGFINDVKKIISKLPAKRQTLFFSATMPEEIVKLSKTILTEPVKIDITPQTKTVDVIKQAVYFVSRADKKKLLIYILKNEDVSSALVFTRTKRGADMVARFLNDAKIHTASIHGDKSQNARQRALDNFKSMRTKVLVATDIAARGIDIDRLSHVFNYDIPEYSETYIHRIGRTGRAGLSGTALSFCGAEERAYLKEITKLIKSAIPVIEDHPFLPGKMNQEIVEKFIRKSRSSKRQGPSHSHGHSQTEFRRSKKRGAGKSRSKKSRTKFKVSN
ncbi:MAG: DEAD/DEAH box helicase [Ignavibacteria bacterium]|nr:DEAD/DEAH box helicase [Ignavibacteria bacterium]